MSLHARQVHHLLALFHLWNEERPSNRAVGGKQPNPKETAMGLFTKDIKTMNDLFVHQLRDMYYAEQQLVKALPKMADKASEPKLKQGFLSHLKETEEHVRRLEQVFKMHGV